ncbi:hypothetical protein [Pseudomonas sp. PB3P13]
MPSLTAPKPLLDKGYGNFPEVVKSACFGLLRLQSRALQTAQFYCSVVENPGVRRTWRARRCDNMSHTRYTLDCHASRTFYLRSETPNAPVLSMEAGAFFFT